MPEENAIEKAKEDAKEGKSPSTQAGEFVREEIHHIREGEHGARSPQQAIAIGLSKARRAGVKLPPPNGGKRSVRKQAERDISKGRSRSGTSKKRSRATLTALQREGHSAASHEALSEQARGNTRRRGAASRHRASMKAARTRHSQHTGRKPGRTRGKTE